MRTWNDWRNIHQPYELDFWKREGIEAVALDSFWSWWQTIMEFVGPRGRCLDVGCGARPPFGKGSTAIDPLIDRYKELTPPEWWEGVRTYSVPAEQRLRIRGFDTVLCWNCIDHTIGWQDILANLRAYGKPDATFAIATDFHRPCAGHPGFGREEFLIELERHFRIVKRAENFQERALALVLCAR